MEVTISVDAVIKVAALLTALGVIGGVVLKCVQFVQRQKAQDKELTAIKEQHKEDKAAIQSEQTLICYGLAACLDGLVQLGCNHSVTTAKEKLDKHLNLAAHQQEAT